MQVSLTPDNKAIISGNEFVTYRELDKRSNQIAHHLISMGLIPGDYVGICLERSVNMVISVLGVLKSGCAYLPLDPSFPTERLSFMFQDSGARILISQESDLSKKEHFLTDLTILIDKEIQTLEKYSDSRPDIQITNDSLAYLIYTSGSTGKPKGVKVHHQAVVNFLNSMKKKPGFNDKDRLLAVTTLSFDISVLELFLPLSFGGELIISSEDEIFDGQKIAFLLDKHDITIMQGTPATWSVLIGTGWRGKKNLKALCGGETLTSNLAGQLLPKVGELWNMYGPTETTVWSTCFQVKDKVSSILVGKPIDNTAIYILDEYNKILSFGNKGEVGIGGTGVAKGYHNRPELTREKFIKLKNGEIIYKTGDQGKFLEDGNIQLFGRIDEQLKLRGVRIEPEEIETLLSDIKGIIEAVVKVHHFEENDDRLVAFLHIDNEFRMTDNEISGMLTTKLPGFMIPDFYQNIRNFPRMPNGKINRKALVFENKEFCRATERSHELFSEAEKRLLNIWGSILRTENISKSDNFFEIGGNSLLAIRLINRIREEFGINLLFNALLINPMLDQLSNYLDNQVKGSIKLIELIHLPGTDHLPLTKNQKRIWLVTKLQPDIPTYIITLTYKLEGCLDRNIFQRSLELLFQRHHVLFTVISEDGDEPYCKIREQEVKVNYLDYSELEEGKKETSVMDFLDSESVRIFDLITGPLYRLFLIYTGNFTFYFHISVHHIIFDGWSWPIFLNDLGEIYNSLAEGKELLMQDLSYQQYDYAYWESQSGQLNFDETQINYWKHTLTDVTPFLNFPYDFLHKAYSSGRGGHENIQLTQTLSDKLRETSKEENISLFGILLGVYAIMLQKYSGEEDICIGTPIASRPHSELENILGMFVNTLVIRLKFERNYTFREFLRITQKTLSEALAHQDLPFDNVVEIINPVRSVNINPLFQLSFVWQNNLNVPLKLKGVKSQYIIGQGGTSVFDLTMYMWENGDIIEGLIEYNSDLLRRETIIRFKDNFLALAGRLSEKNDAPLSSIPIISEEEQQLVLGFAGKQVPYPKEKTIVQLFEEQVRNNPDKTAVVFKESSLTYRELNYRTNQLAGTLRKIGIKQNKPVGILVDKSIEMIVGILGILKAGGTYLPIDPEYPNQRVNFIVKESDCSVFLTQRKYMGVPVKGVTMLDLNSPYIYRGKKEDIESINSSSDLAYIMYTSGTTGVPNGSMIRQYSVVRLVRNTDYIKLSPEDRILLTGAIVFDSTTFEIWGSLLNGATLHIVEKDTILSPEKLGEELLKNEITILWLTSPLFTHIAEVRTDIFSKLKYLLVGGDVLSAQHINKVRKDNPLLKVINGYGPTENTTFSTTFLIERDFEHNIPIGNPINNSTVFIFDKYLNYQPIGVVGEIYVGGDGLSAGYLNREDFNRSRFIVNPHKPGERLYKTGDFGKWLPDGNIEFHGRIDNQIKIRGFRVELGEIESVISDLEGVKETVVKPLKMENGDYRLAAFLNVTESFVTDLNELRHKVRVILPSYMLPSAYKFLHGFPQTISGKTNREALVFDTGELEVMEERCNELLTGTEEAVYEIWSAVLKTKNISINDNFFEIGGNSLLSITIMSKIKSIFNIDLSLRVFFDSPRIKNIAEVIDVSLAKTAKESNSGKKNNLYSRIKSGEL